jgi:hypothetical protein
MPLAIAFILPILKLYLNSSIKRILHVYRDGLKFERLIRKGKRICLVGFYDNLIV